MNWRTTTDDIYLLINSLTKGEKKYFINKTNRQGGKEKYLDLFRFIDRMREWNPKILDAKYSILMNGSFQVMKNYLYRSILQTLNEQYPDKFGTQIQAAQFLLDRELFVPARRELQKVKKKAEKEERFDWLQRIYPLELVILDRMNGKTAIETAKTVLDEQNETRKHLYQLERITAIREQLWWMGQSNYMGNQEFQKQITEIEKELEREPENGSKRTELEVLKIRYLIFLSIGDHDHAGDQCREMLDLYHRNPFLLQEQEYEYLRYHLFSARHSIETGDEEHALEIIDALDQKLTNTNSYPNLRTTSQFYSLLLCKVKTHDQILALEDTISLGTNLTQLIRKAISFGLAWLHWSEGDLNKASAWINEYKRIIRTGRQLRLDLEVRLLSVIIHFELGNYDLVDYEAMNAIRFLKRQGIQENEADQFLKWLRRCLNELGTDRYTPLVQKMVAKLEAIPEAEKGICKMLDFELHFPTLDIMKWVKAKLGAKVLPNV